jgi:hypothetical protein
MHTFSFAQLLALGLLAAATHASAYVVVDGAPGDDLVSKRFVVSCNTNLFTWTVLNRVQGSAAVRVRSTLEARHHTEAQM